MKQPVWMVCPALAALSLALLSPPLLGVQTPDHDEPRRRKPVDWPWAHQAQDLALLERILTDNSSRPVRQGPGIVDHHVHVLGPDVLRDWKSLGVTFSRPDSIYLSAGALLQRRGDSVAAVVLVPMGHLYANPEFVGALKIDADEVRRRVRRENAHVAAAAARFPGRAVALCSVPALAAWALEDLRWCHDSLGVAGIKLHLASSQVDLRQRTHLDRLAGIARFAHEHDLPMLLHVDPQRRGHDSTHIRDLAEQVFEPLPNLTVVIAHLGGSGGYGPWTRTVFRTLRRWRQEVELRGPPRKLYFELSAVLLEQESEGVPATTDAEASMLRDDLRSMGFDRVLFGSDHPVFDPVRGQEALRQRVGLTSGEVDRLARGVGAGVFRARECQPPPLPMERLLALRTQRFVVSDSLRGPLALGLVSCLASRDPVVRDEVAVSALSVWLRGKLLPAPLVQALGERALALLTAPPDTGGFAQSFAALLLSEVVRADQLDSALAPRTLTAISEATIGHMTAIRDYRGYDATEGWRHDVAHSADLILRLGMHPRLPTPTIERLLDALASQVGGHDAHLFLSSEPERMARTVAGIYGRGVLPAEFWDRWMRGIADPGSLGHWGNAFQDAVGMARRQNTLSFLHALGFAARVATPTPHTALQAWVDRELRRMIAM